MLVIRKTLLSITGIVHGLCAAKPQGAPFSQTMSVKDSGPEFSAGCPCVLKTLKDLRYCKLGSPEDKDENLDLLGR